MCENCLHSPATSESRSAWCCIASRILICGGTAVGPIPSLSCEHQQTTLSRRAASVFGLRHKSAKNKVRWVEIILQVRGVIHKRCQQEHTQRLHICGASGKQTRTPFFTVSSNEPKNGENSKAWRFKRTPCYESSNNHISPAALYRT